MRERSYKSPAGWGLSVPFFNANMALYDGEVGMFDETDSVSKFFDNRSKTLADQPKTRSSILTEHPPGCLAFQGVPGGPSKYSQFKGKHERITSSIADKHPVWGAVLLVGNAWAWTSANLPIQTDQNDRAISCRWHHRYRGPFGGPKNE